MAKRQSIEAKVLEFFTDYDQKVVETVYNLIQPIVKKRFGVVKTRAKRKTSTPATTQVAGAGCSIA